MTGLNRLANVSSTGDPSKTQLDDAADDTDNSSVWATSATPSVEVMRGSCVSSSIEVLDGLRKFNHNRQTAPSALARGRRVVSTPIHLARLNQLCIGESEGPAKENKELLSMADFLEFCEIKPDNFHTKLAISNNIITTWTFFRESDESKLVRLGFKAGPARLICIGVNKIERMTLNNDAHENSPEL
jgi:hypothetical protein